MNRRHAVLTAMALLAAVLCASKRHASKHRSAGDIRGKGVAQLWWLLTGWDVCDLDVRWAAGCACTRQQHRPGSAQLYDVAGSMQTASGCTAASLPRAELHPCCLAFLMAGLQGPISMLTAASPQHEV